MKETKKNTGVSHAKSHTSTERIVSAAVVATTVAVAAVVKEREGKGIVVAVEERGEQIHSLQEVQQQALVPEEETVRIEMKAKAKSVRDHAMTGRYHTHVPPELHSKEVSVIDLHRVTLVVHCKGKLSQKRKKVSQTPLRFKNKTLRDSSTNNIPAAVNGTEILQMLQLKA